MIHNKGKFVLRLVALVGLLALSMAPSLGMAATHGPRIYWADSVTGKIQRANSDDPGAEDLVTGLTGPVGIALDIAAGKMYWTEGYTVDLYKLANGEGNGKIQRANLDGTGIEELLTDLDSPMDIALDVAAGKMYWTEGGVVYVDSKLANGADNGKIRCANLDGSGVQDLITGLTGPIGIALDVAAGTMYWTEQQADLVGATDISSHLDSVIKRANLDGTGIEQVGPGLTGRLQDIALDVAAGKMYWTSYFGYASGPIGFGVGGIQRANLDGTEVEVLVTGSESDSPMGIVLDVAAGKMYWTEGGVVYVDSKLANGTDDGKIRRANLDGSGAEDVVTGLVRPWGIALHFATALTVNTDGGGSGTVASDPAGIFCGADCAEVYYESMSVTLTAHPGVKSYFVEWSGDCSGTEFTVQFIMDTDKTCTATFGYPIGGIVVPVNKLGLVAPWMGLVGLAAVVGVLLLRAQRRR